MGTEKIYQKQLEEGMGAQGRRHLKQKEEYMQMHRDIDECLVHLRNCRCHWVWLECRVEMKEWWEMKRRGMRRKQRPDHICFPTADLYGTCTVCQVMHYVRYRFSSTSQAIFFPVSFADSFTFVHLLNIIEPQDTALASLLFFIYIFSLAISFNPMELHTHNTLMAQPNFSTMYPPQRSHIEYPMAC